MKKVAKEKNPMRIPLMCGMMIALLPLALFAQRSWRLARGFTHQAGDDSIKVRRARSDNTTLSFEYSLPALKVTSTATAAQRVKLGSAPQRSRPGEPLVPVIPVQIVLPAGRTLDHVALQTGTTVEIPGSHRIEHGQKPIPLIKNANRVVIGPDAKIYDSDNPYPARRVEVVGVQKKRGVAVAIINIFPMAYRPRSGRLVGYISVKLDVVTKPASAAEGVHGGHAIQRQLYMSVENPEDLDSYENGSSNEAGGVQPLGICDPADSYRYVVITGAALRDATTDVTLRDLISHKQSRGISATIVTVEDIYAGYTGVDNPERIRNFIIDAYSNWETEYVLLGGDVGIIPVRYLYDDGTTIPSDLYYQCLDGTFNYDGDSYWGEPNDGPWGGDVDLMAEVAVGRASAENPAEMSNFVYKTIAYANESESAPFLRQAMLLGEYLGSQFGPGVYAYAYPYMKEIHHGSSASGYTTVGFDACAVFSVDSMYDYFGDWPASDLIASFNSDAVSIYNHLGHANETNVMKLANSNVDVLTNTKPFFAYSQGCYPGDYTADCIAEHFTTTHRHGAFAVVFNSRYGWGAYNEADETMDGPSQRFDRQFWDAYFGEYILTFGDVNADSHEDNIWDINGNYIRWCMYETNLFGDPQLLIRGQVTGPMVQYLSHTINDAAGNGDGLVNPGEQIVIRPTVVNVGSGNANGVSLQITTTDGYVTLVDNTADVGNISCCGASQQALDNMVVNIASNCPTPHTIQFTLTAHDNATGEWTSEFYITVYTSSQVSGYVRAAYNGSALAGATVSFNGPLSGFVTTDAAGHYLFGGIDGTYSITAIAEGFLVSAPVSVTLPPTVTGVNFNLVRPLISHSPDHLRVDVVSGGSDNRIMTISNSGDAPLNFTVAAQDNVAASVLPAEALYDASHFVPLVKGAPDTRMGNPVSLGSGGPDAFGYRWTDSDEPGGPAFIWNDISGTGSILPTVSGCDDCYQSVTLSFPFEFYGVEFTTMYVSSNGYITFGSGSSQYGNYALPSTSMPANLIAGFFDDLYPGSSGTIYFQDFGDRAVVQFTNVAPYSGSGSFTYQMVIERNGTITYYYNSMSGTLTSATVGIQNGTQDDGLTVVYNASYIKNGLAVQLRAAPAWLSVSPESGTVPADGSIDLDVQFTSDGLIAGLFNGNLAVEHNDPTSENPLLIPCEMYVDGMRRLSVNPLSYEYPSMWVGQSADAELTFTNEGDEATEVTSITSTSGLFVPQAILPLTVPPFGSLTVPVTFTPVSVGTFTATVTIVSNAEDNPVIAVMLQGEGTAPPEISVSPGSIDAILQTGESSIQTLSVTNSGGSDLVFNLNTQYLPSLHKITAIQSIVESMVEQSGIRVHPLTIDTGTNGTGVGTAGDTLTEERQIAFCKVNTDAAKFGLPNVLIAGAPSTASWLEDIVDKTLATGQFTSVTYINVSTSTPSLTDLQEFDAVMVFWDAGYQNSATLGDNLAAYVDGGGAVVATVFEVANGRLAGRWTNDYRVIVSTGQTQGTMLTLGSVLIPDHPIMTNVLQFNGGSSSYRASSITLMPGAEVVANWSNDDPLIATRIIGDSRRVDLNFYPPSSSVRSDFWDASTDGALIMANALSWASGSVSWLSVDPMSGILPAGMSMEIQVFLDATDALEGDYTANINFFHNGPGSPSPLSIPVHLYVDGVRHLSAAPSVLEFGSCWVGTSDTILLTLSNNGSEATQVSSISSSHSSFTALGSLPFTVTPFEAVTVPVVYQPGSVGSHSGTLIITSDAEDNPSITVSLSGTAISAPSIAVSPQQVSVTLAVDESTQRSVSLINAGGDDLVWAINQGCGGLVSQETHDTIPGIQSRSYTATHDLTCDYWSDAGNDAFDGFGNPSVAVGGISSTICMLEGDSSYTINGYNIRVRNDFAENHIYRSIIEPQTGESSDRSDITVNFNGNMGSDGSETVYLDSVQVAGVWLRFYVNEVSFPNSDPRVVFLIVSSRIEHRDSVRYWQPSSGYAAMEARNISLPATVYIIPSYHALSSIKAWFQNDLVLRNNWLSVSPNSGTTPAGQIANLLLSFSTVGMQEGTYHDTIKVAHNAPDQVSPLDIPVMLLVNDEGEGCISLITGIGISALIEAQGVAYTLRGITIGSPAAGLLRGNHYCLRLR